MGNENKVEDICEIYSINQNEVDKARKDIIAEEKSMELSKLFKVLGDPTRLKIIDALSKRELCVCDIAEVLEMTQSAISHQLRVLRDLRLVKFKKLGKSALYSLDDDHVLGLFNQGLEHINHS